MVRHGWAAYAWQSQPGADNGHPPQALAGAAAAAAQATGSVPAPQPTAAGAVGLYFTPPTLGREAFDARSRQITPQACPCGAVMTQR